MLRSAVFAIVVLVVAACSAGTAPPTSAPTSGVTAAPTAPGTAVPTAAPTLGATPTASPSLGPTTGPAGEVCGTDWFTSPGECGGTIGDQFVFQCPPGGREIPIYGTDTYTDDSATCTAAVHVGLISFETGGTVTVEIRAGLSAYVGSTRYGVDSSDWGSWPTSYVFVGGAAVVPTPSAGTDFGYGADTLLLNDDFSDTSGGWQTDSGPSGSVAYEAEKLAIDLTADVSYLSTSGSISSSSWDVMRIEATVTGSGGNGTNYIGLLCGPTAENAAGVAIGTDGLIAFIQRTGTNYAALDINNGLPQLLNDQPAQLTLECAGTSTGSLRLRVSLNDVPVAEYVGDAGPENFQTASVYVEGKAGASFTIDDVSVFGGDAAGLPPLPTAAPSPGTSEAPSGEMEALLAHVPAAMNVDCHEVTTLSAGEVIAVSCSPPTVTGYITYTLFDSEDTVLDKWLGDLDYFGDGAEGPNCTTGPCLVAWERGGFPEGRYFVNNYTGIDPTGLIAYWFDSGLMIEASLVVYNTTFAETRNLALQAGPNP